MKYIVGLFLITIGVLFIFQGFNLGLLIRIGINFVRFWPLILVMIGLSILSKNYKWIKFFNMGVLIMFILLLFFWDYNTSFINFSGSSTNYEKRSIDILPDNEAIFLYFDVPGVSLDITTDQHSDVISCYYYGPRELSLSQKKGYVKLEMINEHNFPMHLKDGYKIYLVLPNDHVFNIFVSSGVSNISLKEDINVIRIFDVDSGVININGEIKEFKENLYLNIDGGVSNISFSLPKNTTYYLNHEDGIRKINVDKDLIESLNSVFKITADSGIFSLNLKTE